MAFGFMVARLFLRSQCRKMLKLGTSEEFFCNTSIWMYVIFIILLEIFISYLLTRIFFGIIPYFYIIIIVIFLFMAWILVGTWCMREKELEKMKQKKSKAQKKGKK